MKRMISWIATQSFLCASLATQGFAAPPSFVYAGDQVEMDANQAAEREMRKNNRRLKVLYAPTITKEELSAACSAAGAIPLFAINREYHVAWLSSADPTALSQQSTAIEFVGDYLPSMSNGLKADSSSGGDIGVMIRLVDDNACVEGLQTFCEQHHIEINQYSQMTAGGMSQWSALASKDKLDELASLDGVVYIEPLATGVKYAGEGSALIAGSQTFFKDLNTSLGDDIDIELPFFPSSSGVDYIQFLEDAFSQLGLSTSHFANPDNYALITSIDSGIDDGDLDNPEIDEFYSGGTTSGVSRYAAGFQWKYDETEIDAIPLPADSFPFVEFKGNPLDLGNPPEPSDRQDTGTFIGHGSGVMQMAIAHPRPGQGEWRDEPTGLARSSGVSPYGRFAIARWPDAPFPTSPDPAPVSPTPTPVPPSQVSQFLSPPDVLRTVGEIHRQQYLVENNPSELAKGYTDQDPSISGRQLAIVNGAMGITASDESTTVFDYNSYAEIFDKLTRNSRPDSWYSNIDSPGSLAESLFVIAAGNSVGLDIGIIDSIWTPGIAKNVLTVGGSAPFEFLSYGTAQAVIGREVAGDVEEFPYQINFLAIASGSQTSIPIETSGSNPVVIEPIFSPGTSIDGCADGTYDIRLAVTSNPAYAAPDQFTFLLIIPPTVTIENVANGDLGDASVKTLSPGVLAVTSSGNPANTDVTPDLATITFRTTTPGGVCNPYNLLFISYGGLWRNANNGADTSYGVDPAVAYPTSAGAPQRRIKPDVVSIARRVQQRQYPDLFYTTVFGTSQATGMVSGLSQLSRYVLENYYGRTNISPALLKAYVVHSASPINGSRTGPTPATTTRIPSPYQGYGRIRTDYALKPLERFFVDQSLIFSEFNNGTPLIDRWAYFGKVDDPTEPTQIALTWTDAAAVPGAARWIDELRNDLDLHVQVRRPDGSVHYYAGNNFSDQQSNLQESVVYTYPTSANPVEILLNPWDIVDQDNPDSLDAYNNVEMVHVPPQPAGSRVIVYIRASDLTDDALNPFGDNPPKLPFIGNRQDFALVAANFDRKSLFQLILDELLNE